MPTLRPSRISPRLRFGACLALTLCLAAPAHAQADRTGRLEGQVIDSTHARPLVGARVVAVSMDQPATTSGATVTDSAGRYHIDSLPPGRYAVGFEIPLLDSLEMNLSPRWVVVTPGQTATTDLALPPAAKLRGALCPGVTLPQQTGVIFGHVVDTESENPLPDVVLAMSWQEREFDRTTLRAVERERTASTTTDSGGWYRVCGVPTDTWISLQLQHAGRAGPVLRELVGDTLGIAVRHLSFTAPMSRPAPDTAAVLPLSGSAMLSGIVRGAGDAPLASADVQVRGTGTASKTDALGRYSLTGLPAGTQMLDVRHVGYSAAETPVELRSGSIVTRDVRLPRIANLDSIRVVATRQRYSAFNEALKHSVGAVFLGPEEMEQRQRVAAYTSDVITRLSGFAVIGVGSKARVVATRGPYSGCRVPIVIDGFAGAFSINDLAAAHIGAMAAYRPGDVGPSQYIGVCGAILIWTKR